MRYLRQFGYLAIKALSETLWQRGRNPLSLLPIIMHERQVITPAIDTGEIRNEDSSAARYAGLNSHILTW